VADDDELLASVLRKLWTSPDRTWGDVKIEDGLYQVSIESMYVRVTPAELAAVARIERPDD
jgi:hypothetical protein